MRESLFAIVMRLATGEAVTTDQLERLLIAAAGDDDPATALGLDRATRVRLRNAALIRAACLLSSGDSSTPWQLAIRLAQAVNRFEVRTWPMLRAGGRLADLDPLDLELARAFMAADVPRTARMLYAMLKR